MSEPDSPLQSLIERLKTLAQANQRDPLDSGSSASEPELARFGSLHLTSRRIVQCYPWQQSTAPLSRIVRVDVKRIHNRTWFLLAIFCALAGWSMKLWLELETFLVVGTSGALLCLLFYMLSRRTRLMVSLEDGSSLQVAVRNKHFTQASRFANIVCRVATLWEPPLERSTTEISTAMPSRAALEIEDVEDDEYDTDDPEESGLDPATEVDRGKAETPEKGALPWPDQLSSAEDPTVEIKRPPAGWLKMDEPAQNG